MKNLLRVFAFLAIGALVGRASLAADAARAAAPSGLAVLAAARAAMGGSAWSRCAAVTGEGRIVTSGLPGRWRRTDDLRTGRFATSVDVGAFRQAEGSDGRAHWRQDASGGVHALDAPFSQQATRTEAWLAERGWLRRAAGGASVGAAQQRNEEGGAYAVVLVTPRDGQPVELWFDAASHVLARTVRQMPISLLTVRYGDHRRVGGRLLPFHVETRESGSSQVETVDVARWRCDRVIAARAFAAPTPPDDTELAGETRVAIGVDGFVTVPARLNGRPFEFILDTGGHDILTPAAAAALGLQPLGHGASGGAGAGELAEQHVRVATLQIGAATLRDQHFYVLPLQYGTVERGAKPELAGLIGLELFERLRVRIDYAGRSLTLSRFGTGPATRREHEVPIVFDDDMPLLEARLDGAAGLFAIDTGNAGSTVVQARWAQRTGMAEAMKRGIETVSYGAGGASRNWVSRLDAIEIAGTRIEHVVGRYAEDEVGSFSSRTEAGNVGTDVLAGFVVDIDYARGTMAFEPRPGYVPPPYNRSGLRAIKEDAASFRVVLVTPGSPAAEAGLEADDRIVAVDGVPAPMLSQRDLAAKSIQAVGEDIVLDLRRGDATRTVTLRLRESLP